MVSQTVVGVITARMGSSRFPGKPIAPILGRPMIEHIYRRSRMATRYDAVLIATCDDEIRACAEAFGAPVVMTSDRHERAAERAAEAAAGRTEDIAVLIQGDEPMVHPDMLDALVAPLLDDASLLCTNLMLAIGDDDARDPDQVKVVCDARGDALYMSREPLPTFRYKAPPPRWRQLGLIAFRREFLVRLMAMPSTPLERAESVDMLRALEYGFPVRMVATSHVTYAVDTPGDVARVEALMKNDPLLAAYGAAGRR
jgi:3-deoxy-manno-octulosonate cytidylyltransferase (CMP-KDO synthetase)